MDIFQQDWTNQMKTDPFVNKIMYQTLNNESYIHYDLVKKYKGKNQRVKFRRRKIRKPYTDVEMAKLDKIPVVEEIKGKKGNIWYITKKTLDIQQPMTEHYWQNTRPQSLYNLNYATLR